MHVEKFYLTAESDAFIKARAEAARARLSVLREVRPQPLDAKPKEMRNVLVLADFRHGDRRFSGKPLTGWGELA